MAVNVYGTASTLRMRRSLFNRSFSHKTSEPFGKLVPIGMPQEVLPGDLWSLTLSNVKRMLTPKAPIMDDISADIYGFFVPNRIIWSKAKAFFGENDAVAWTLPENVEIPSIELDFSTVNNISQPTSDYDTLQEAYDDSNSCLYLTDSNNKVVDSIFKGTLFEYLGLPFVWPTMEVITEMDDKYLSGDNVVSLFINALPFRAVQMIYNEFFRNENITDPILSLNYDGLDFTWDADEFIQYILWKRGTGTKPTETIIRKYRVFDCPPVARWKDLFTSCLPAPQRGPSVGLPLLGDAVVKTSDTALLATNDIPLRVDPHFTQVLENAADISLGVRIPGLIPGESSKTVRDIPVKGYAASTDTFTFTMGGPNNLYADLSNVAMATVNEIRLAFATQRYYEKLARGGARYNEYLQVMFGVRPSDAVLQRPQFLGGKHVHINVAQVIATANSTDADGDVQSLGQTGAYSATAFKDHIFSNSFTEHGVLMCFVCNRKEHTYCQGMDKYWTKSDVFDIYNPTFAHIGEVPVMRNEVYWMPEDHNVLGYNEAWYEYRSFGSKTTGLLNPMHPEALGYYVLTDVFDSAPALTDEFILEDPKGLDRALVASASVTDQFISDYYFNYKLARVMPVRSYPGLIDHY